MIIKTDEGYEEEREERSRERERGRRVRFNDERSKPLLPSLVPDQLVLPRTTD